MKISKIQVANVAGIARAEIEINNPLLVVAGANMAGKTSLRDAIAMAMTGEIQRVSLKKDLPQIVHAGAKKGRATIYQGDEILGEYQLPKGEFAGPDFDGFEFLPFVVDPHRFASLKLDDRRAELFRITKAGASMRVIEPMLDRRGINMDRFAEVKAFIRSGFPAVEKAAQDKAREDKALWKATTGETWGLEKGEGFRFERPVASVNVTAEEVEEAAKQLALADADLAEANESLISYRTRYEIQESQIEQIETLRGMASQIPRYETKLAVDEASLAEWQAKLEAAKAAAEGRSSGVGMKCPCCDAMLIVENGKLLDLSKEKKSDPEAKARLSEYAGYVAGAQNAVNNSRKALAEAQAAELSVANFEGANDEPLTLEAIANGTEQVEEMRAERARLRTFHQQLTQQFNQANEIPEKEAQAAEIHTRITEWLAIADAMAPSGIPSDLLKTAMEPFNQSLSILSGMANWPVVQLRSDLEIVSNDRPYGLCSESEKWRADALIALAIAQITGLRFVVLDRFDVLEIAARPDLFGLMLDLKDADAIDHIIAIGTLKSKPDFGDEIQTVWIHNCIAES